MPDLRDASSDTTEKIAYPLLAKRLRLESSKWPHALAALLFAGSLIAFALIKSLVVRALLPLVLAAVAITILIRRRRSPPPSREAGPRRSLELSTHDIELVREGRRLPLADLRERFGVTLLSNKKRSRVVAAFTSGSGAFLVGTVLSEEDRRTLSRRLSRAHVIASDESALSAIGPDGAPIVLRATDFADLLDRLERREPDCTMRMILSDASGAPLSLDKRALKVKNVAFDLTRPLEWEPLLFQESFGEAVALYQGTRVKQGADEIVLVSLLPPALLDPAPYDQEPAGVPELDLAANRDQRLMQALPQAPPPLSLRVGVDGLFMLPLRDALDRAPRMNAPQERHSHP